MSLYNDNEEIEFPVNDQPLVVLDFLQHDLRDRMVSMQGYAVDLLQRFGNNNQLDEDIPNFIKLVLWNAEYLNSILDKLDTYMDSQKE